MFYAIRATMKFLRTGTHIFHSSSKWFLTWLLTALPYGMVFVVLLIGIVIETFTGRIRVLGNFSSVLKRA